MIDKKTSVDAAQMKELYDLRRDKAWSWYELANKYGITCDEARRAYSTWQAHLDSWASFREEHPKPRPDFAYLNE